MGGGGGPCEVVGLSCIVVGTESVKDEVVSVIMDVEIATVDGITETIGVVVEDEIIRGKPGADM